MNTPPFFICGIHSALAALNNKERKILNVSLTASNFEKYKNLIKNFKHQILENKQLDQMVGSNISHQGIAVKTFSLEYSIYDINLELPNLRVAILDQVTDPQNIGAVLRSAAAFEIDAVILPRHNSPSENSLIAKTACGALEVVKLIKVTNISSTIKTLKEHGFWVIGFDSNTKEYVTAGMLQGKNVFVFGAEGKGIRRLVLENCDVISKIPISSSMESLNISNASAIIFYESFKTLTNNSSKY